MRTRFFITSICAVWVAMAQSQSLPDVFTLSTGKKIALKEEWYALRQPEILRFFEKEVYGRQPVTRDLTFHFQTLESDVQVLNGKALRRQVRMFMVSRHQDTATVDILVYYPARAKKSKVPVFTLLNYGNHTLTEDEDILLSVSTFYSIRQKRAAFIRRFPVEMIIDHGCAVITSCYEDFIPDNDALFRRAATEFYDIHPDSTGAISLWAWAYSRLVDYALQQKFTDPKRVAVVGHSRTGKAALWAAAQDSKIKFAFINESGNSGAKLNFHLDSRAETIERINTQFPHWFPAAYEKYNGRDLTQSLPYDQHWLIAAIAPRHVYVGNAREDHWGDPPGEYLSLKEAEKVYRFLGLKTFLPPQQPGTGQGIAKGFCGYHIREGNHDLLPEDWMQFIRFTKQ